MVLCSSSAKLLVSETICVCVRGYVDSVLSITAHRCGGMLVLLSPAKSINTDAEDTIISCSTPGFDTDTAVLLQTLQSYSKAVLQHTLGISPSLARQVV